MDICRHRFTNAAWVSGLFLWLLLEDIRTTRRGINCNVPYVFEWHIADACHPYEPFKCPGDGNCISIQYLCDGAPDCSDGYDEDMRLCTAGKFNGQSRHRCRIFILVFLLFSQTAARRGDRLVSAELARLTRTQLSGEAFRQQGTRCPRTVGRRREGGHCVE